MGRGGKVGFKRSSRRRARVASKGSDESDEDYTVGEDEELDESEDEYVSSFDGDESEESLGEFEEEEEEEEEEEFIEKKVKRVGRPKKGVPGKKTNGIVKSKRKKQISYRKKVIDDSDEYGGGKRNGVEKHRKRSLVSYRERDEDDYDDSDEYKGGKRNEVTKPRKKKMVSYREQDDDNCDDSDDDDDDDDDDDEEFTPDEIYNVVDDEDLMTETKKNKKLRRPRQQEKRITRGQKRNMTKVLKADRTKKPEKNPNMMGKAKSRIHVEIRGGKARVEDKKMITGQGGRKRRRTVESDSDFESSGLSDYEYTISEEEREQVREANKFCRNLATSLRSLAPAKKLQVKQESVHSQMKRPGRKGKEKEEDVKIETGKQVCGICLSQEGKRTVRGTLNCCSHYFCFACIMEWSKVESRCPLCKQRFGTISKPARSHTEFDLRTVVIQVPERDQVYQPSEEELRGYLDPYENVICSECQLGGDDALMLLCDLCDSPAHTYCVGLGHEVPEGNWYCEGCRPTALASSNQGLNPTPDQRTVNNLSGGSSPIGHVRETFDLNEAYVPDTPLSQGMGQPSPRLSVVDFQAAPSASGFGAFTVLERRRIQHQIRQIFNIRRQLDSETNSTMPTVSENSLFSSQVGRGRVVASQHAAMPERRTTATDNSSFQGRLQGNMALLHSSNTIPPRFPHLRGPVIDSQASTSTGTSFGGFLQNEFAGINTRLSSGLGLQRIHPCSTRSNIGSDVSSSPLPCREVSPFNVEKEQVQSVVRSHLKSLSRDMDLGNSTFKDIARSSTHTILAACGLEHRLSEVYPVQAPLICVHVDRMAGSETCPMKGSCSSCFDLFVRNVVREITNSKVTLVSKD